MYESFRGCLLCNHLFLRTLVLILFYLFREINQDSSLKALVIDPNFISIVEILGIIRDADTNATSAIAPSICIDSSGNSYIGYSDAADSQLVTQLAVPVGA